MGRLIRKALRVLAVSASGTVLLLAGIVMLVTPGPGLVLIAAAVAVFALQFRWAQRLAVWAGGQLATLIPERHHPHLRRLGLLEDHSHRGTADGPAADSDSRAA